MKTEDRLTLVELIEAIIPLIEAKHYHRVYEANLKRIFKKLAEYCRIHDEQYFSTALGEQFLNDRFGGLNGFDSRIYAKERRAMDMLSDYQHFGTVMLRRRKERKFPPQFRSDAEAYLTQMERDGKRPNTIKSHKNSLLKFTDFLDSSGVTKTEGIVLVFANNYIKATLSNYQSNVAKHHHSIMRGFLYHLSDTGKIDGNLAAKVIRVKRSTASMNLPASFTADQIESILSQIDRESPAGKRDFAVLMLATKLGLRTSDIKNLKPENIHWERNSIHISQVKTGEPLALPLPLDVGWALIDYMKNGRPDSEEPEIFLRAAAPYVSLQNFDNILVKYMQMAGIPLNRTKHHGLHTLRHSLATHMLDKEVPITAIQSVLGHVHAATTERYIGINVNQLSLCAQEVPEV
jgi:site-specific recombinase XerD